MEEEAENYSAENRQPAGHTREANLAILYTNLTQHFRLSHEAANFVIMIYKFSQFFDDIADGDAITRSDLDLNLYNCFVGLNSNAFFVHHRLSLLPVMDVIVLKWQASDQAERDGMADERSFMWRAGFYDLLLLCVSICNDHNITKKLAFDVMTFYAETMENYRKEFPKNG